jgi:hypothetical protein
MVRKLVLVNWKMLTSQSTISNTPQKHHLKVKLLLGFDDDEYIGLFDPSDDDMWYYLRVYYIKL